MAERRFDKYAMKDGDTDLDEGYFNPIWRDLDNRLFGVEDIGERVNAATTELVGAGLRRIDEFLRPAYDNIADLSELGFLTATIQDDGPVTFALTSKTVVINEGPERNQFRPTPYLTFQVGADYRKVAVAVSQMYDRDTGALTVEFIDLSPELAAAPGPHSGIFISSAAGSTVATLNAVNDAHADREAAEDAADTAVAAAGTAVSAKAAAETARDTAKATVQSQLGAYNFGAFPATRLDGSALQAGDKLYDKTNKFERVYDGSTGFVPVVTVSIGGVTITPGTFSGGSNVITIAGGFSDCLLWVNGVLLIKSDDYTAASPTITVPGVSNGDTYVVWSFKALAATDYATKEELNNAIAGTASASSLSSLATVVSGKASQSSVDTLTTAVGNLSAGAGSVVTGNMTAVAGGEYYVKTATGAVSITLPAAPAEGNVVTIWRYGANAVNILRNGKTIRFVADDISIDTDRVYVVMKYFDGNWTPIPGTF